MITADDLEDVDDPFTLFKLATKAVDDHRAALDDLAALRVRALAALYATGYSYRELSEIFKISAPRLSQLVTSNDAAALQVLRAWAALEPLLNDIASHRRVARSRTKYLDAVAVLREEELVDDQALEDLRALRGTRNDVVHGRREISIDEAEALADKAIYLAAQLHLAARQLSTR